VKIAIQFFSYLAFIF